jgi:hypothetical protein
LYGLAITFGPVAEFNACRGKETQTIGMKLGHACRGKETQAIEMILDNVCRGKEMQTIEGICIGLAITLVAHQA